MIVALFLLPLALIHDVSFFVYFAGMCLAIIFVSLGTVSYYMVKLNQKLGPSDDYTTSNWKRFPEFFGIACFSLEGIGLIFLSLNSKFIFYLISLFIFMLLFLTKYQSDIN